MKPPIILIAAIVLFILFLKLSGKILKFVLILGVIALAVSFVLSFVRGDGGLLQSGFELLTASIPFNGR